MARSEGTSCLRTDFLRWLDLQTSFYVIYEAALLLETSAYEYLDRTLLVVASKELRLQRVLIRDPQRSAKEVLHIMSTQLSNQKARSLVSSKDIIKNDNRSLLTPRVLSLHQKIIADLSADK